MTAVVSAVVVSHETRDLLRACLHSLATEPLQEIVVVDNASTDGSVSMVRREFPRVRLLARRDNPGYGAAANAGVAATSAPYVLVLNADARVLSNAVGALAGELDRQPEVAVVGPRLFNPDGSHQSSCFPMLTPFAVFAINSQINRLVRLTPGLRDRFLPIYRPPRAGPVEWVKGAALAVRRSAFDEVGGFDERYFLYAEEMDLCWRLRMAGWQVRFAPEARVVHVEGAAIRRRRGERIVQLYASLARFHRRYSPPGTVTRLRRAVRFVVLENLLVETMRSWCTRDPDRRREIEAQLEEWRRVLQERPVR